MGKAANIIPEQRLAQLEQMGYRCVTGEEQLFFGPYFDGMNERWSSACSFLCMVAWRDVIPTFFKPAEGLLLCMQYDGVGGGWTAIPFLGRYTQDGVERAFRILSGDMKALGFPMKVMGVSQWMLPFYEGLKDISWETESLRASMEYVYRREDFSASMDKSDSRYRCRYFMRHFAPETVVLTSADTAECLECMRTVWCSHMQCPDCFGCPLDAIEAVMRNFDRLKADGLLMRVDGKPVGFCITSCRKGLGIYHFLYANNRLKGINEYLLRECFDRFLDGAEEINYTEDLGIESLRAFKCKLAPYTLFPRITLRRRRNIGNNEKEA